MALTKVTGKGITCSAVTEDKLGTSSVTTNKINNDAVTSAKINNGAVTADDLASTLDLSSKTVTLPSDVVADAKRPVQDNIALLGFKMAVNDGLTIFNLVDGVVDEFNDESGTDESEGSNDTYCGTSDYYINSSTPDGNPIGPYSAGFSTTAITEPDTSTAGTNPTFGSGTFGVFTVPSNVTSLTVKAFGAGGGAGAPGAPATGGGGGFSTGTLAVTPSQTLYVSAGEGGQQKGPSGNNRAFYNGGNTSGNPAPSNPGTGGGLTGVFTAAHPSLSTAPQAYIVAGSGGGGGSFLSGNNGGAGGGLTGDAGGTTLEQTAKQPAPSHPSAPSPYDQGGGGGGGQAAGGQGGSDAGLYTGCSGGLFQGGTGATDGDCGATAGGGGGAGYYGGGGGAGSETSPIEYAAGGGGGSSYYAHPQVTCGSTEEAGPSFSAGGSADPDYVSCTSRGGCGPAARGTGDDGYVLLLACQAATVVSTTIVSNAFTSTSVATSARIVVFEENVDTPTLNTDIIASISRDAGVTYTNATLSDSGYVTGSSGQRILTGQADISGQPSGQSMRWKLALANNTVKIHGVALQWS